MSKEGKEAKNDALMDAKTYSRMQTNRRYAQANKMKMSRSSYRDTCEFSHLAGALHIILQTFEEHRREPFEDVDTLMGYLHGEYKLLSDTMRCSFLYHLPKLSMEDIIAFTNKKKNEDDNGN